MNRASSRASAGTIAELGEFGLIDRIARRLHRPGRDVPVGIGDDTAVIDMGGPTLLLATVDMQVEGRHFIRERTPPRLFGRRIGAVNLSDIASMGGRPRWALTSLALPPDLPTEWVDEFVDGIDAILTEFGAVVVGGNLSGAEQIAADLTLLGEAERGQILTRAGALPGDLICVTGSLGRSAAGRAALDAGLEDAGFSATIEAHLAPVPRVREGQILAQMGRVHAMIDLSDGLAGDLRHICEASGTGAMVYADRLPLADDTRRIARRLGLDPVALAAAGGEDFELLFTTAPDSVEALTAALAGGIGTALTVIGEIVEDGYRMVGGNGDMLKLGGWDHFALTDPSSGPSPR
ncbi:MAG: thiamine-phosphate kinase [Dehalococcoidia bacterium]